MLEEYAELMNIPLRHATAHRTIEECQRLVKEGTGILNSKHRWSLAHDYWIITSSGKDIEWKCTGYAILGRFWKFLGGRWGGDWKKKDIFHFELAERPA